MPEKKHNVPWHESQKVSNEAKQEMLAKMLAPPVKSNLKAMPGKVWYNGTVIFMSSSDGWVKIGTHTEVDLTPPKLSFQAHADEYIGTIVNQNNNIFKENSGDTLGRLLPGLRETAPCPSEEKPPAPSKDLQKMFLHDPWSNTCHNGSTVGAMIIHLNDYHHWSRQDIADWLDTLDTDLQFPNPEDTTEGEQ